MLYLSIGNLDRLAWDDGGSTARGSETELLGNVLRIDPATGELEVFASGLRNVYGLDFDEAGVLWGVDNDGRGRGWRFEELSASRGLDFGFPDDGTVGPYTRRTGFATWILPSGAGSGGLEVAGRDRHQRRVRIGRPACASSPRRRRGSANGRPSRLRDRHRRTARRASPARARCSVGSRSP